MASISSVPISLPNLPSLPSISKSTSVNTQSSSLLFPSSLSLSTKPTLFHTNSHQKKGRKLWITLATPEEVLPSDSTPLDNSQQIVSSTGDEGVATVIQALLFVAFVALSILTIGVIYIAVQDFLGKREREKFEKEEAARNKSGKKKKKKNVRARAGPRGFGQKLDEDDDDDI
ncbi:hypothetical protein F383_23137 [Gossypium arboreum]|uniref:Uncharacterized protein n=6 Tax=Gossypium TaxID=3633 RepID=A0ABR0PAL3_GOSAR|nr:uncharacterized protein LOC107942402 [Gossypium hirsutum]XP_017633430.1 uncharacterized protein LOC108475936 [Gossypium arboreum]KAB2073797.1 hypothetical protein ES319_A07G109000v1 [Gossypium barbadense]TYH09689.1 hypothetical protein ES288_A07G116800v1 [Gossypium darwinii]TYI18769.1 hypothetical protein ES332_A07G115600v1 [Gossypium tomentosum]KAG4191530.1 hypothetical protein ERO13_A07G099900v2 [Gossypium hirsutum]KAK5818331.1 hypothetical protein PVK06_023266 [Gossypium arboreum]